MTYPKILFSSNKMNWATPDDFFRRLNQEFRFNLDPCAHPDTAKCERYFTERDNGLLQDWGCSRVF